MDERAPWERQKGEGRKAYAAFVNYRDSGTQRSVRRTATELSKSASLCGRWSARYNWVARAEAWDAEKDSVARAEQLEAVKDMNRRHVNMAKALQGVAGQWLRHVSDRTRQLLDVLGDPGRSDFEKSEALKALAATIDVDTLIRMADAGAKLERLAVGVPTEITRRLDGQGPIEEWANLTDDDIRKVLAREAAGGTGVTAPGETPSP